MRHRYFRLAAVAAALVGYWSPWLTHPAAALRLNGYELSEWITFLPGVRSGDLPLSRLLFLLPLACLALLLVLVATRLTSPMTLPPLGEAARQPTRAARPRAGWAAALPALAGPWAWALLLAAGVCAFTLFPPYPYLLTALRDPEFQGQFFVASLTLVGLIIVGYLPTPLKDALQAGLGLAGALLGLLAMLTLRPAASVLLNTPWPIGFGWLLMLAGFSLLSLGGLTQLFGARE